MFGNHFELNEETIPVVEEIGRHMPGAFFLYQEKGEGRLLYANQMTAELFGCRDISEFRELTGFTFQGMVHPEDYEAVKQEIQEQISDNEGRMDHTEYRIVRKDREVRLLSECRAMLQEGYRNHPERAA